MRITTYLQIIFLGKRWVSFSRSILHVPVLGSHLIVKNSEPQPKRYTIKIIKNQTFRPFVTWNHQIWHLPCLFATISLSSLGAFGRSTHRPLQWHRPLPAEELPSLWPSSWWSLMVGSNSNVLPLNIGTIMGEYWDNHGYYHDLPWFTWVWWILIDIPSSSLLHNYGTSPSSIGQSWN